MAEIGIDWGIVSAHIDIAFRWQQGSDGGCTWRDIPTVELEGK